MVGYPFKYIDASPLTRVSNRVLQLNKNTPTIRHSKSRLGVRRYRYCNRCTAGYAAPAFLIDTQHRVIGWNREMEVLTGIDRSEVLGDDDTAKFFRDNRTQTLANAIVEHPRRADEEFGAERSGRDQRAYEVEQEMENQDGKMLYVHSVATPIYQDDRLQGVIQLVQDNTEIIRRREAMGNLVEEAVDTAQALEDGNLSARVDYTDSRDLLDALDEVVVASQEASEGIAEVADANDDQAASVEEITSTSEQVAGWADDIEDRIGEITEETAEQRNAIDDMVDNLNELTAEDRIDREDKNIAAATDRVDGASLD